jgi:hypothetical protein
MTMLINHADGDVLTRPACRSVTSRFVAASTSGQALLMVAAISLRNLVSANA